MSYKTYRVQEEDAVYLRTTTDGYQPKFLVDQGRRFLKVQCELNRMLRDDWRVEDIASRICDRYGIYAVHQTPCRVMIGTRRGELQRMGVVSDNFAAQGYQFLSFSTLLQLDKSDRPDFRKLDAAAKLDFMEQVMCTVTGISHERIREYLYQMVFVDLLVLNQDRHLKNLGVFYKIDQKRFEPARLFDFGMGLFENDTMYDGLEDLKDCLRYSYVEPFGEDPFELADMLKESESFRIFLKGKDIKNLKISRRFFSHPAGYPYFKRMKKALEL